MSYTFKRSESVTNGIRRIAREQLRIAIDSLQVDSSQQLAGVHQARKCLKKLRALLRAMHPGLGSWKSQAEATFKSISSHLAGVRDADALHLTLERLRQQHEPELGAEIFTTVKKLLPELGNRDQPQFQELAAQLPAVLEELQQQHHDVRNWDTSETDVSSLFQKIRRRYGQGRAALRLAMDDHQIELLHEWRKCCKDHWYHLQLLKRTWPAVLQARIEACSQLCDLLGDDHDLALLTDLVSKSIADQSTPVQLDGFLKQIEGDRQKLEQQAFHLGRLIFAEKKAALETRLTQYWKIWKSKSSAD